MRLDVMIGEIVLDSCKAQSKEGHQTGKECYWAIKLKKRDL